MMRRKWGEILRNGGRSQNSAGSNRILFCLHINVLVFHYIEEQSQNVLGAIDAALGLAYFWQRFNCGFCVFMWTEIFVFKQHLREQDSFFTANISQVRVD